MTGSKASVGRLFLVFAEENALLGVTGISDNRLPQSDASRKPPTRPPSAEFHRLTPFGFPTICRFAQLTCRGNHLMRMALSPEANPKEVKIKVNLPAVLRQMQVQLQRLSDLVTIGLAGALKVAKTDYDVAPEFMSLQIASNERMPFEAARDDFQAWCLKNSFKEAIDLVSAFLEECRTVATLFRLAGRCSGADWNRGLVTEKQKFHDFGFPRKIEHLRKQFGVASKLEAHVLSLNRARNCLVHRLGVVSEKDVDASGKLVMTWHSLSLIIVDNATKVETAVTQPTLIESESTLQARIGPHQREFAVGERIQLSHHEHSSTILTYYVFALEIVQALEKLQPAGPTAKTDEVRS